MQKAEVVSRIVAHARRHGFVITRAEALRLGASPHLLAELVRSGVLTRKHPAVYAVAGAPDDHALAVRVALAALDDPYATASHASAAWLQGLIDLSPAPATVHVTTGPEHRRINGVALHRSARPVAGVRRFRGIPCTPPARTLVDLAATAPPAQLDVAVDRAISTGLVRPRDLLAEVVTGGGRRGTGSLRRCLAERGDIGAPTPSVLESLMGRLYTRFQLPAVQAEHVAGPNGEYRIDYVHQPQRVAVELYGYLWHHSPEQMHHDLARQRRLTLEGWTVLVFTWRDVTTDPARVAREIRHALARRRAAV